MSICTGFSRSWLINLPGFAELIPPLFSFGDAGLLVTFIGKLNKQGDFSFQSLIGPPGLVPGLVPAAAAVDDWFCWLGQALAEGRSVV